MPNCRNRYADINHFLKSRKNIFVIKTELNTIECSRGLKNIGHIVDYIRDILRNTYDINMF